MNSLVVLPVLLPLVTAALALAFPQRWRVQRWVGLGGALALLGVAVALLVVVWHRGILAVQMGGWAAPFGITLAADLLSATLVLLTAVMGTSVGCYALADINPPRQRFGFSSLYNVLLAGICGAFLTGDLFNLYVWFEVLLMASFVLMALGGERLQLEGTLKYLTLNLVASALFLAGAGLLYGVARTLNLADLSIRVAELRPEHPHLLAAIAALFLVAFGIKAAIFPLAFWLPASYPTPPAAVAAIFAGLLTKVGVYALTRVFTLVFPLDGPTGGLLLVLAAASMLVGVLGAASQMQLRRILSFHSISQIGYMVFGVSLLIAPDPATRTLGLAASLVYVIHHALVKGNLFLISGAVAALRGTESLVSLGGLARTAPWLATLFLVTALSLAGVPPLSGFWAKLATIKAGLDAGQYLLVTAALVTGLLTLLSMIKIWNEAFWKAEPATAPPAPRPQPGAAWRIAPIVALTLLMAALGVLPGPLFTLARRAAEQTQDRAAYVEAVGLHTRVRLAVSTPPMVAADAPAHAEATP